MRSAAPLLALSLVLGGLLLPLLAPPARAAVADWTFLVYMGADNNLEGPGIDDFLEMASVGSTPLVNIVVQFDRAVGFDVRYGDWTTTKRFLVQAGMTPTPANATMDLGEVDMAAPASLVSFATWGAAAYPAKHYFLDLWDHGLGWQGVILDDSPITYMTTAQLGPAIAQVRTALGRNVDIVGLDACRFTVEIMAELQPSVDYFVGSEKDEPLAGWPYDTFLAAVVAAPVMTPVQVGTWLTTAYVASYFGTSPYSVNLALVSGGALPSLVRAFADFVAELNASVPLLQSQVLAARLATERYERNGLAGGDEFDLFHFSENIVERSGNPRLAALARALQGAIASAVLAHAAWDNPTPTNGVHAAHTHGLSIWFPDTPSDPAYDALALSRATGWNGFLATYRSGSPTSIPTGATARSVDTSLPTDGLADAIRVDATPRANGSLVVVLTEHESIVASLQVPVLTDQAEALNLTGPHPGRFNVTVLFYVGGKLSDLVTVSGLGIQARYRFLGSVLDPQGRPVGGATVTLQNARTSVVLSGRTDDSSGQYSLGAIVPDFFVDGDTLVLTASSEGRQASAAFVASARGTSQTVNIVLDTSATAGVNAGLIVLGAGSLVLAIVLAGIAVWQREQIRGLRRRLP